MITLQGLVSTYGDRADALDLPFAPDVSWVVVHQQAGHRPPVAGRADVTYVVQDGRGLSRSRNAALEAASAEHLFVLDDDVTVDLAIMRRLAAQAREARADVACGYHRFTDGTSTLRRHDPQRVTRLGIGSVTSIDLSFRRQAVLDAGVRFDTDFGLGARWPSCEEAVFLGDCLKAGLRVTRFSEAWATHPPLSSGEDFYSTAERGRVRQQMLRRIFGPVAPPFVLAFWAKKLPEAARHGHARTFTRAMLRP